MIEQPEVPALVDLRKVMRFFASGITVMASADGGRPHAMTVSAVTSVSLDPPLILCCVAKDTRMCEIVTKTDYWTISLLASHQQAIAEHFAIRGRDRHRQFTGIETVVAPTTGLPLIKGALIWLECVTWARYDGGDHDIVVGQVIDRGRPTGMSALTYFAGGYHTL